MIFFNYQNIFLAAITSLKKLTTLIITLIINSINIIMFMNFVYMIMKIMIVIILVYFINRMKTLCNGRTSVIIININLVNAWWHFAKFYHISLKIHSDLILSNQYVNQNLCQVLTLMFF